MFKKTYAIRITTDDRMIIEKIKPGRKGIAKALGCSEIDLDVYVGPESKLFAYTFGNLVKEDPNDYANALCGKTEEDESICGDAIVAGADYYLTFDEANKILLELVKEINRDKILLELVKETNCDKK